MGLDYVINLSCKPKLAFGNGDLARGTADVLARTKAKSQADMIAQMAEDEGQSVDDIAVTIADGDGNERDVSHAELVQMAAPLAKHASHCEDCPANIVGRPYGCVGSVSYPIDGDAEAWMLARVVGAGPQAQELMFAAIDDFEYDGEDIRQYREEGIFENKTALTAKLSRPVSTDQIFHAVLSVGEELEAFHCLMLLVWMGAVTLADKKAEDVDLGDMPEPLGALELYALFTAMGAAAASDVSLLIDS
jgi:hypothetical protein